MGRFADRDERVERRWARVSDEAHQYSVSCTSPAARMATQVRYELQSWGVESWAKIKPGSIYHALKKAAADGLPHRTRRAGNSGPERVLYRATARGRDEIVELVRDGLRRTHDPAMLNVHRHVAHADQDRCHRALNERSRLEAELVVQAKWWEHPNRDTPEHVRDQPNCGRDTHAPNWSGRRG